MIAPSDPPVPSADPAATARRNVWCATKSGMVSGSIAQHPEGGTLYGCELLTLDEALAAFERFRADPKTFWIDTADDNSVIVMMGRGDRAVTLDLWLDAPYGAASLDTDQVPALIEAVYEPIGDEEVAARITALGGELHPYRQSWPWPEVSLGLLVLSGLFASLVLGR